MNKLFIDECYFFPLTINPDMLQARKTLFDQII